ncbi:MAG: dephospho-CoA kinase [Chitinophagaceae bacterium]
MLRIGLTGGIGSGKTTVAKIFELLGVPVYYADEAAKRLMKENKEIKTAIKKTFGEEAYLNDELNRSYLAKKVFNDVYQLELLNTIIHPLTIKDAAEWMQKQSAPYVIKEAAIFFESGSAENIDYIIGVYAPQALRIQRAMKRDNVSREEVLKRMSRQIDEAIKLKLCNFLLKNDEQELLIPQVLELHQKFLSLANAKIFPQRAQS